MIVTLVKQLKISILVTAFFVWPFFVQADEKFDTAMAEKINVRKQFILANKEKLEQFFTLSVPDQNKSNSNSNQSYPSPEALLVTLDQMSIGIFYRSDLSENNLKLLNSQFWSEQDRRQVLELLLHIEKNIFNFSYKDYADPQTKADLGVKLFRIVSDYNLESLFLLNLIDQNRINSFRFFSSLIEGSNNMNKVDFFIKIILKKNISLTTLKMTLENLVKQLNEASVIKIIANIPLRNAVGSEQDNKTKFVFKLFIQKANAISSTDIFTSVLRKVFSTPEGFQYNLDVLNELIFKSNPVQLSHLMIQMKIVKDLRKIQQAILNIQKRMTEFNASRIPIPEYIKNAANDLKTKLDLQIAASENSQTKYTNKFNGLFIHQLLNCSDIYK